MVPAMGTIDMHVKLLRRTRMFSCYVSTVTWFRNNAVDTTYKVKARKASAQVMRHLRALDQFWGR
jgi:hypothetical protein